MSFHKSHLVQTYFGVINFEYPLEINSFNALKLNYFYSFSDALKIFIN
jgi:hypothetical protein